MAVTGVDAIQTSFVTEFNTNIQLLLQRQGSLLRDSVTLGNHTGKSAVPVEQIGAVAAQKRVTRHGDTPLIPTPYGRRWVYPTDYEWADLIDDQDKLRMLVDPDNAYARNAVLALGRAMDEEIISALGGASSTGETGGASVNLSNTIANGSTGMTIDKLRQARQLLKSGDVQPGEELYLVLSPIAEQQLLATTEVTSSDYAAVKALVQGEIDTFLGFKFICHTGLTDAGSNIRECFAWAKSGMHCGVWDDVMTRIDERSDKSYATQVYAKMTCGATRLEEGKVVQIDIDESV